MNTQQDVASDFLMALGLDTEDLSIRSGVNRVLSGYDQSMLIRLREENRDEYDAYITFITKPYKDLSASYRVAYFATFIDREQLNKLASKIRGYYQAYEREQRSLPSDEYHKCLTEIEQLTERISKVSQYASWALDMRDVLMDMVFSMGN